MHFQLSMFFISSCTGAKSQKEAQLIVDGQVYDIVFTI